MGKHIRRRKRRQNTVSKIVNGQFAKYRTQFLSGEFSIPYRGNPAVIEYVATLMTLAYIEGRQAEISAIRSGKA